MDEGSMTSRKRYECPYCRQMIKDKWLIGTFHFCLEPEARYRIDHQRHEHANRLRAQQSKVVHPLARLRNPHVLSNYGLKSDDSHRHSAIQVWRMKD